MKATVSKDGHMRISVRVTFRLAHRDIVDGLMYYMLRDENPSLATLTTRRKVVRVCQDALYHFGDTLWAAVEGEGNDEIEKECQALTDRLFPDLKVQPEKQNATE